MQLSVVILNYNVQFFLELCILSVQKAIENIHAEIIVVDNNSSDESCKMILKRFPDVQLIQNNENFGFSKGNNIGVKMASGDYICILNPDTVVAEDTFEKTLKFAKNQQDFGILGCKLIDGKGNFLPESKRGVPTPWVAITKISGLYHFFPKSKFFNQYYAQHLSENETGKVAILVGAFMLMQRKLYNQIGGFDENCFMYSDDIDLSYNVLKSGKSNFYFHDTTVIHYKGESTVKDEKYMKRFQEAMNFFYKKHFKISVFFSVFMQIGILFFSFFKKRQGISKPVVKPENYILIADNIKLAERLRHTLQKPLEIQKLSQFFSQKDNPEVILDNNLLSFKTIIDTFENQKNKGFTFKILPQSSEFMIGSNSSYDRGEVVKF